MVPFVTHNCVVMRMEVKGPPLALSSLGMLPHQAPERREVFCSLTFEDGPFGVVLGDECRREGEAHNRAGMGKGGSGVSAVLTDRHNDCSPYVPSSLLSITSHGGFPRHRGPVCTNPSLLLGLSLARPLEKPQMQKYLVPTRRAGSFLWVLGPP